VADEKASYVQMKLWESAHPSELRPGDILVSAGSRRWTHMGRVGGELILRDEQGQTHWWKMESPRWAVMREIRR
jgi:hypothetical protein